MKKHTVLHQWRGLSCSIGVATHDKVRILHVLPLIGEGKRTFEQDDIHTRRLRKAADIALGLDASLARSVCSGQAIRIRIRKPRSRHALALRTADEVIALRPQIEDLIAPLLFDPSSNSHLRPFQKSGVHWLVNRHAGILADDMGLGKTVQSLSAMRELIEKGIVTSVLVVCPKSLISNWETECKRWVPKLTVVRVVPSKNNAESVWAAIHGRAHIVLTNYEQLRPLPHCLAAMRTELVIVDEAHRLRKAQAKLVKAFRLLKTERIWALTGTPIERHEEDLAVLLSLLEPSRFSAKSPSGDYTGLRALARPYILRRIKSDVLRELPRVIEKKETVELTDVQRHAYASVLTRPVPKKDLGEVLQKLTLLRSICDAEPTSGASVKIDRIVEILHSVQKASEKAVVFSYLLQPLYFLLRRLTQEEPLIRVALLTGELHSDLREKVISEFKSDDSIVALLCSSKVGGEGLTLTEANHVIFLNEWWNPSANAQARDRVVRLGQKRIVHVHRFRCSDTVEESLDLIIDRKTEAFTKIVDALSVGALWNEFEAKELAEHLEDNMI